MHYIPYTVCAIVLLLNQATHAAPSQVANTTDPIYNPYQEAAETTSCSGATCTLTFPPTAVRTMILHASCTTVLVGSISTVVLQAPGSPGLNNYLQPFTYSTIDGATFYGINSDAYLFFKAGQTPVVEVGSSTTPSVFACTLSGYGLSPAPFP
jgi:hypothetical protein